MVPLGTCCFVSKKRCKECGYGTLNEISRSSITNHEKQAYTPITTAPANRTSACCLRCGAVCNVQSAPIDICPGIQLFSTTYSVPTAGVERTKTRILASWRKQKVIKTRVVPGSGLKVTSMQQIINDQQILVRRRERLQHTGPSDKHRKTHSDRNIQFVIRDYVCVIPPEHIQ
jgi:hypothetical protein